MDGGRAIDEGGANGIERLMRMKSSREATATQTLVKLLLPGVSANTCL
jgi:hypothetical protein